MKKIFSSNALINLLILGLLFGMISINNTLVANARNTTSFPIRNNNGTLVPIPTHFPSFPTLEPSVTVQGYVYDAGKEGGEAHGYPLYASIHITNRQGDNYTIYTDPITGFYSIALGAGGYTFETTAMVAGYSTKTEIVRPDPGDILPPAIYRHNIRLNVDNINCSFAGYEPASIFYSFEDSAEDFTPGGKTSFAWGEFISGPDAGHSGTKGIATNLSGNYNPNEYGYMLSPEIDLTSFGSNSAVIQWWEWRHIEESNLWDWVSFQVTKDSGESWQTVWGPLGGGDGSAYSQQTVVLDPVYNVEDFQMRFFFKSDYSNQFEGWYIDDIGISSLDATSSETAFFSNFDIDDGGFYAVDLISYGGVIQRVWNYAEPTAGPGSAYSSPYSWFTGSESVYPPNAKNALVSPSIDLSAYAGLTSTISFMQWYHVAPPDKGILQASKDGGETWNDIWSPPENSEETSWTPISVQLDSSYSVSNFQFRFYFESDGSVTDAGWYIDDVAVSYIYPPCVPIPGGVIAGYVSDAKDNAAIIGADVVSDADATQSFAVDGDYEHPGVYWLFQPLTDADQDVQLVASKAMYTSETAVVEVVEDAVTQQDFSLEAGELTIAPNALEVTIGKGGMPESEDLTISNIGPADTAFQIFEKGEQVFEATNGTFASPPAFVIDGRDSKLVKIPNVNHPSDWNTIGFWPTGTYFDDADFVGGDFSTLYAIKSEENGQHLYSIDTTSSKYTLIGDIVLAEGTYIYGVTGAPDDTLYGVAIDNESNSHLIDIDIANGQANDLGVLPDVDTGIDLAFNPADDMIYMLDDQNDCLVIINPATLVAIDTIDLDIGVNWSNYSQKIDFEEESGVLFWVTGYLGPYDELRIIDWETGQSSLVGSFQFNYMVSSLAFPTGPTSNVPWFSENPVSGMVSPDEEATVSVTFDPSGLDVGNYYATLQVKSLTIPGIDVPVVLHVIEYPKLYLPMIEK